MHSPSGSSGLAGMSSPFSPRERRATTAEQDATDETLPTLKTNSSPMNMETTPCSCIPTQGRYPLGDRGMEESHGDGPIPPEAQGHAVGCIPTQRRSRVGRHFWSRIHPLAILNTNLEDAYQCRRRIAEPNVELCARTCGDFASSNCRGDRHILLA